jgi:Virulence factor membrane-bound polymerase, C-terminal/O-Antigen ligase
VGLVGLAFWGLAARSLRTPVRALLVVAPVVYGLAQLGLTQQSIAPLQAGTSLLSRTGDVTSSRFMIWQQSLEIAAQRPLVGVGFGEFNTAWTFTPFVSRLPDQGPLDHAHNIFFHWIVEFGWPLAAVLVGLVLWAAIAAWRNLKRAKGDNEGSTRALRSCVFAALALVGLHSLLEYPLWYSFFLLPTAFLWGFALSWAQERPETPAVATRGMRVPLIAGVSLSAASFLAFADFIPAYQLAYAVDRRLPLPAAIASARGSVLFSAYADWIEATELGATSVVAKRARHFIIDRKLLAAWAAAAAREGNLEQSDHLWQRLRELCVANPALEPAACKSAQAGAAPSLSKPMPRLDWRALR